MAAKKAPAPAAASAEAAPKPRSAAKASTGGTAAKAAATAQPAPAPAPAAPPAPEKATPSPTVGLKQLAAQLAEVHQMPRKQAEAVMADVVGLVVERLKAGERLRLQGLGILEVKHRPARQGRNPATGAAIQIAASKKVAFRPAKELKDAM